MKKKHIVDHLASFTEMMFIVGMKWQLFISHLFNFLGKRKNLRNIRSLEFFKILLLVLHFPFQTLLS